MASSILQPVVALVLWSLVMWAWLYATRIPAMQKAKVALDPGTTTAEFSAQLPPQVRWKADNYNHLMEQPTIFYAAALAIQVAGHADGWALRLAWTYVVLRVLHSLVQVSVNIVGARFLMFLLSTVTLAVMVVREMARLAS